MKLLAVSSEGNGTTADLYLEIQRGSGRVFMDTFPFTKFDTQLSTRLAKDIACDFLEIDCSNYDFIYTIRADSPIIGGPSAGAAFTILTISLLDDIEVEETTTITGTINAGGFIGDVGSISKKIDAAAKQGIKKVLIPKGDRFEEIKEETTRYGRYYRRNLTRINESKTTLDLYEHGNRLGVEVVEVSNLYEAVYETTGKQFPQETGNITPDEWYTDTMKEVSIILCNRTKGFRDQLNLENLNNNSIYNMGLNLTIQAIDSFDDNDYYAGASFCFGANVKYDFLFLNQTNTSYKEAINTTEILRESINQSFKNLREQELNSIASLQTYIIVNERLIEAELILEEINTLNETQLQDYLYNLAFATERLYSAYAWSMFFDKNNAKLKLNEEILKNSPAENEDYFVVPKVIE